MMHFFICVYSETLHVSKGYTVHHQEFTRYGICSCCTYHAEYTAAYTVKCELRMMNGVSVRSMQSFKINTYEKVHLVGLFIKANR